MSYDELRALSHATNEHPPNASRERKLHMRIWTRLSRRGWSSFFEIYGALEVAS